ncbi:helix-turn-helix domain-containing protein [Yinghuangia sp. YIM S09857]|uniref:helix-turn-helix domain-containing protein n=1 Tax=Yinghuangia sp. YIM S09857 TaxID=3436929 RepID=UPI003F5378A8
MRENPYEGMSALAYFGRKLKEFREKAGLSQAALAKELNYSDGLVAMVETARRSPSREFAILTDRVLKTKTEGVLELLWYVVHNSDNRDWYPDYVALEASAIQIDYFSPTVVPGLLQTEAYAREVVNAGWVYAPEAAEEVVALRMRRQELIGRGGQPKVWAVVDESVLLRRVGSEAIMRDQLIHLADLLRRRVVVLQVLPLSAGAHAGMNGGVVLLSFEDSPTCAYVEGMAGGKLVDLPTAVRLCEHSYDLLRTAALSPEASLRLLDSLTGGDA